MRYLTTAEVAERYRTAESTVRYATMINGSQVSAPRSPRHFGDRGPRRRIGNRGPSWRNRSGGRRGICALWCVRPARQS
ncbi:hypothetical protein [Streptomyces sp. NRRL S-1314]|uniref:hypothetical protein n=1 Tax=Streptomyces sp. NRRL S-1314 TaxID=1463882 RepID=UPI000A887CD5|nr:hypothetical protein [Streptomyces sp. NRRL S-1314]